MQPLGSLTGSREGVTGESGELGENTTHTTCTYNVHCTRRAVHDYI